MPARNHHVNNNRATIEGCPYKRIEQVKPMQGLIKIKAAAIPWLAGVSFILFVLSACSTNYQILKYQGSVSSSEHIIPGIEPEESARKIMIVVKGKGIEPEEGTPMQKKFMAERAAVLDGYRKLSERLAGMIVNAQTHSGKNTLSMDEIYTETRSYLRGAQVGTVTYQDGFAIVDVKLYIAPRQSIFLQDRIIY